jgi:succinyl-diaminopimelate desuccinylase
MSGPPPELLEYVEGNTAATVDRLLTLLSFDTRNPPGETAQLADHVEESLGSLGVETERVVADPAKPNVVATLPGESDRTLLFEGHLDTVPFEASDWAHDPHGERDGDRVYGRGATDMKGALAAMLTVVAAYAETGTTPPVTLQFAFVSDEEVAGEAGLPAVLDAGLSADWCVIGETTCGDYHSVTVADRGSMWITLEAEGVAAHGSRPMLGENAIDRLYRAVERIRREFGTERLEYPDALDPIVEESVAYYAPSMGESTARSLFTHPTINLGTIEGGESVNSVPLHARAELDVRLTAGVDTSDVLRRVRACAADCEGIGIADVSWSVGTYEPMDSPLVEAVSELAGSVAGDRVFRRSATGGGDAKQLRNANVSTVEFGFGTDTAHAVEEYTTTAALRGNALVYAQLPYRLASIDGNSGR